MRGPFVFLAACIDFGPKQRQRLTITFTSMGVDRVENNKTKTASIGVLESIEFLLFIVHNSRAVRAPTGIDAQEVGSFHPCAKWAYLVHGGPVHDHYARTVGTSYFDMKSHCLS
jgi:hypothetical protein